MLQTSASVSFVFETDVIALQSSHLSFSQYAYASTILYPKLDKDKF